MLVEGISGFVVCFEEVVLDLGFDFVLLTGVLSETTFGFDLD